MADNEQQPAADAEEPDERERGDEPGDARGEGQGGTSDDDRQPDDTGATGTLGDHGLP